MSARDRGRVLARGLLASAAFAAQLATASSAVAACPDDVCDCLGEAASFATVSESLKLRHSIDKYNRPYTLNSNVLDHACTGTAAITASTAGDTAANVVGDLIALESKPAKAAVNFSAVKGQAYPVFDPEVPLIVIDGDLVTGGGKVTNQSPVPPLVTGAVDVSGTSPKLASCAQAQVDARNASAVLASLPPTQVFGPIKLEGQSMTITAGPGRNVIYVDSIWLDSDRDGNSSELAIEGSPGTESVVINTRKLRVGGDFAFLFDFAPNVIFNVTTASSVSLGYYAGTAAILAPRSTIRTTHGLSSGHLFGRKLLLNGAIAVNRSLSCS